MADGRDEESGPVPEGHVDVSALVLGDVDGSRRAEMAAHLLGCQTCRSEYDEVAATVAALLPAVPAVEPPIGFDEQVLGRLGAGLPPRGAHRQRRWALLTGAAALLLVVGALGWFAIRSDDAEVIGAVTTLQLVDGGDPVGTVSIGDVDGEPVMVVAVVVAPEDVSYLCRTTFTDGTTSDSEAWSPGTGAWIVPLPMEGTEVATVDLVVDGTDHVWSTASFGA